MTSEPEDDQDFQGDDFGDDEPDDDEPDDDWEEQGPQVRHRFRAWLRRGAPVVVWLGVLSSSGFAFVRVFGLERNWIGYTLIAFTPYVAVGSLVVSAVAAALRRKRAALVALISTFTLVCLFVPRLVGHADPAQGPALRAMSTNMEIGGADAGAIVRLVQQHHVDVLAVQEYTTHAQAALQAAGLSLLLPYSVQVPVSCCANGSALFSRYPLTQTGHTTFPGWFRQAYGVVHVPGAQPVYVMSVHPRAPVRPSSIPYWHSDLMHEPTATPHGQVRLLIGDFNSTLDHAILRRLIDTGYHDAAAELGDGLVTTWPYDGRPVPRIALDHALVDPRIGVSSFEAHQVPGTDHRSIIVTVTLPKA